MAHNIGRNESMEPKTDGTGDIPDVARVGTQSHQVNAYAHTLRDPWEGNDSGLIPRLLNKFHMPPSLL